MGASKHYADQVFTPAPAGRRVRMVTTLVLLLFPTLILVIALLQPRDPVGVYVFAVLSPLAGLAVAAIAWFLARISAYRLVDGELVVIRRLQCPRFSLDGLVSVASDPQALRRALRIVGNDGLGAISGRFRSRRLGRFRAYATDGEKAVVLLWSDRCVVVTPERPASFIDAVSRRAGLRS